MTIKQENQYPVWKKARMVPVDQLNPTAYNPPGRTHGNSFKKLCEAIRQTGIQMPILCTTDGRIVDGHRRFYAMQAIGKTEIPVLFLDVNLDPDHVWASINTTSKPVNGAEWTHAYSLGLPIEHVDKNYKRELEAIETIGRKEIIDEMAMRNLSARVMQIVKKTVRYVQREDDPEFMAICLRWMIEQKASYHARKAMEAGIAPYLLEMAITQNKSLSTRNEYVLG